MRKFPESWQSYSEVEAWDAELATTRVRVRLADGAETELSGALPCSTAWLTTDADPADAHPLGESPGAHLSGQAYLAIYLPGDRVRIHREDAGRTAYVVEVVENAAPLDRTGDPCWDPSARRPAAPLLHPDLLVTEPA